jgi:tRNA threonylcarbamoyladenosine biosynthesis protein TsaB
MIILMIRSDKPEAEISLFDDEKKLGYKKWQAHRELSQTIHKKIETLLQSHKLGWENIEGIVCYKGPGSFTGLRIGLTVGNALAYSFGVPIVGTTGGDWHENGIKQLQNGENEKSALPEYGAEAHITKPRK